MRRYPVVILSIAALMILLMAGCHKQTASAPPPTVSTAGAVSGSPSAAAQMPPGRATWINGMRNAARQRGQMMHRAPGKP